MSRVPVSGCRRPASLILAVMVLACGSDSPPEGAPSADGDTGLSAHEERVRREMAAIGYVTSLEPTPERTGITAHDRTRAGAGFNLYTSGHGPVAILMDMDGNEVHKWEYGFRDIWPARSIDSRNQSWKAWRYAHLLDDGGLLAIFDDLGIIRLDRDSKLIWASEQKAHHDLEVLPNGDIYTLTSQRNLLPRVNPASLVKEDFITLLSPDGELIHSFSLLEAWESSAYRDELDKKLSGRGDLFHANTLEYFDGSLAHLSPLYNEGNILTSFVTLDTLAIVDTAAEEVVWTLSGDWHGQHYPTLLADGRILLFVNNWLGKASSVRILDPVSGETTWIYEGSPPRSFFSRRCGSAQMLPNGNVLVTESQAGRAFEATADGEIVWEFFSPYEKKTKTGPEIAYLYVLTRYLPGPLTSWLP